MVQKSLASPEKFWIANGVVTRYLVDDLNPTGYPQVVEETGSAPRTYTYGLQRVNENQIINGAQTPSFYGYDGMGSVRQLTNLAGAVTDTYEYDAYGNKIASTGTTPNIYLYRGEQWDPDLGLYYLRARYRSARSRRARRRLPNLRKIERLMNSRFPSKHRRKPNEF